MESPRNIFLAVVLVFITSELVYSQFTIEVVPPNTSPNEVQNILYALAPIVTAGLWVFILLMLLCIGNLVFGYFSVIWRRIEIMINTLKRILGFPRPEERPVALRLVPVVAANGDLRNRHGIYE